VPEKGCAICEATWGDHWDVVDGQRIFFCCDICAAEFKNMVGKVKERTGWKMIDEIKLTGDYRGREGTAHYGDKKYNFFVRFDSKGGLDIFNERS
jgi:hypothetical protein